MFDLSISEMLVIAVLILVVFDADQLPDLMRKAGRIYGQIRGASDDLRRAFNTEVARVDAEKRREEMLRRREEIQARLRANARPDEEAPRVVGRPDPTAPSAAVPSPPVGAPPAATEPATEPAVDPGPPPEDPR